MFTQCIKTKKKTKTSTIQTLIFTERLQVEIRRVNNMIVAIRFIDKET